MKYFFYGQCYVTFALLILSWAGLDNQKTKTKKKSYIFDKYEGHVTSKVK